MPSSIQIDGKEYYRPNSYVTIIDNTQAPSGILGGNVCIIGDFPLMERLKPYVFSTNKTLQEWLTSSFRDESEVKLLKNGFLRPINGTTNSPNSLTIVNAVTNTQASITVGGTKIKSKFWGKAGNTLRVNLSISGDEHKLLIFQRGIEKDPVVFESGNKLSIQHTNAAEPSKVTFGTLTASVTATNFVIDYITTASANSDEITFGLPHSGTVAVSGGDAVIVGFDQDGIARTETVTDGNSSTFQWSRITSFDPDTGVTLTGKILDTELSSIQNVFSFLKTLTDDDSRFDISDLAGETIKGSDLDGFSSGDIKGVTTLLKTVNRDLIRSLSATPFLEGEKVDNTAVSPTNGNVDLVGGSQGTSITSDQWQAALDATKDLDVHVLTVTSSDYAIHAKLKQHCIDTAILGRERNAFVGTAKNQAINVVFSNHVKALNDRNMAVVCQTPVFEGNEEAEPYWLAFLLACIQASTTIATPLTSKVISRTSLTNVRNSNIDLTQEIGKAIQKGIILVVPENGNLKVERSVTTYRKTLAHPVYTEVSANESLNVCLRDLRANLKSTIGGKASSNQLGTVRLIAEDRLKFQKDNLIISNYRNVSVTLTGDIVNLGFELAVMTPQNFLNVSVTLTNT